MMLQRADGPQHDGRYRNKETFFLGLRYSLNYKTAAWVEPAKHGRLDTWLRRFSPRVVVQTPKERRPTCRKPPPPPFSQTGTMQARFQSRKGQLPERRLQLRYFKFACSQNNSGSRGGPLKMVKNALRQEPLQFATHVPSCNPALQERMNKRINK